MIYAPAPSSTRVNDREAVQNGHVFTKHAFCKEFGFGDDVRSPAPSRSRFHSHSFRGAAFSLAVWNLSLGTLVANSAAPPPNPIQITAKGVRTAAEVGSPASGAREQTANSEFATSVPGFRITTPPGPCAARSRLPRLASLPRPRSTERVLSVEWSSRRPAPTRLERTVRFVVHA